ncbi:MAG: hypothetical protein HKN26_13860 [Acidimicrobiales bacterium]|nr:hypothetical protein [Acidimicrobiales bacterium]
MEVARQLRAIDRSSSFGNARVVRQIFEKAVTNQARRIRNVSLPTRAVLMTLEASDI